MNFQHFANSTDNELRYPFFRSSLSYNTSARHGRHECDTNGTSATRVRNFDFDNGKSENIFSHPYISYMENERL